MAIIDKINLNGTTYYLKDEVSGYTTFNYTPLVTEGVEVGRMTFKGNTYIVYAPDPQSSNALNIEFTDGGENLSINHEAGSSVICDSDVTLTKMGPAYDGDIPCLNPLVIGSSYTITVDNYAPVTGLCEDGGGVPAIWTTWPPNPSAGLNLMWEYDILYVIVSPGSAGTFHIKVELAS